MIARFEATDALRRRAIATGSTVRRSNRDVLIRVPGEEAARSARRLEGDPQPRAVDGRHSRGARRARADAAATEEGLAAAHRMFARTSSTGSRRRRTPGDRRQGGTGYRWVDENVIKGLQDEARPKGGPGAGLGRVVDNVNSAVTSLTVYFKIGHIGTRVLTNASTNLIQGSLAPTEFGKSIRLWKALSPEDKARMLAGAGQHGFAALPHEGVGGRRRPIVSPGGPGRGAVLGAARGRAVPVQRPRLRAPQGRVRHARRGAARIGRPRVGRPRPARARVVEDFGGRTPGRPRADLVRPAQPVREAVTSPAASGSTRG
jgi:hypothetical protein